MIARQAEQISARYGCGMVVDLRGPVARGEQGEVWQLVGSRGTWALKLLYEAQSEAEALADADYQDAVRAAGVPLPCVVRTSSGTVLCELDGHCVRLYEWVDLCELDTWLPPAVIGELVASIHRVRSLDTRCPVHEWYCEPVGAERWAEVLVQVEARGGPSVEAQREELVALEGLLAPPRDLQVCHRDLWADNVRRTPTGGICVIDWENAGLADPSQELAAVLFEYGMGEPKRIRGIYEAYVESGGPARIERTGDFSMLIAQLGHIFEWACRRWLDAGTSDDDRAIATERILEATTRPVTRAAIDDMLHAIG